MKKIKVTKENLLEAINEFALIQIHTNGIHYSFNARDIPETLEIKLEDNE